MTTENLDIKTVYGQVKWFDPSKGFGFVVSSEGGPDILLHANVLRNFGQSSIADATGIEISVQKTDRGMQAVEVLRIDPPVTLSNQMEDMAYLSPAELDLIPIVPARVKWFDKAKGFGFANVYGKAEDVFIHAEVLRSSGFADLQPGEAVCLRVIDGQRGRMAVYVLSWDAAIRHVDAPVANEAVINE
ncbi:cold-shock protein [Pseudogemmobacter sp. W21_MBD1_M6]|uniref:cold-shock protein n=1 Tax=Pseudogemmobacter sp. W21_MBD1_M6 TaxID=3240271 RepID=UPI003F960798